MNEWERIELGNEKKRNEKKWIEWKENKKWMRNKGNNENINYKINEKMNEEEIENYKIINMNWRMKKRYEIRIKKRYEDNII